jgi:hypothetical protein
MGGLRDARRDSTIAGVLVAIVAALLTLWTSGLLVAFGVAAIVLGVIVSITVIGAIIGIPLILVGFLGLVAGIVAGAGGVAFAVLFGAGIGYVYYRYRMRALLRDAAPGARRLTR